MTAQHRQDKSKIHSNEVTARKMQGRNEGINTPHRNQKMLNDTKRVIIHTKEWTMCPYSLGHDSY